MSDSEEQPNAMSWLPERTEVDRAERIVRLNSLLPAGYAAYRRIFHTIEKDDRSESSWEVVAAWSGKARHPLAQFEELAASSSPNSGEMPWDGRPPREGTLSARQLSLMLVPLLAGTTATRIVACWWEGFVSATEGNHIDHDRLRYRIERTDVPDESALMIEGKSPQFWWPEDRPWCVASNIDLHSTYVGCSEQVADKLDRIDGLECAVADIEDRIDFGSDLQNRPRS